MGLLIHVKIINDYHVKVLDKQFDGVLVVEIKSKVTEFTCIIFACYLSPENSKWGRDASKFFVHILTIIYMSSYADLIILCRDINSRVGNELDYIPEIDTVKERKILDTSKNTHGKLFIEFLKDAKLCIVNGRVNATKIIKHLFQQGVNLLWIISVYHTNV